MTARIVPITAARRGGRSVAEMDASARRVFDALARLRATASLLRETQRLGLDVREALRAELADSRLELRRVLCREGAARVPRRALAGVALERLRAERAALGHRVARDAWWARALRRRLDSLDERAPQRPEIAARYAACQKRLARAHARLAAMEATPDPLRACGLYGRATRSADLAEIEVPEAF